MSRLAKYDSAREAGILRAHDIDAPDIDLDMAMTESIMAEVPQDAPIRAPNRPRLKRITTTGALDFEREIN